MNNQFSQQSYGMHLEEVGVDMGIGETSMSRGHPERAPPAAHIILLELVH